MDENAVNKPPFRQLSKEEYERLNLAQRVEYLSALMADIREKLDEARDQAERAKVIPPK